MRTFGFTATAITSAASMTFDADAPPSRAKAEANVQALQSVLHMTDTQARRVQPRPQPRQTGLYHRTCKAGRRTACCHQPAGHGAAHLQHAQRRRLHLRIITAIFDVLQLSDVVSSSLMVCLSAHVRTF